MTTHHLETSRHVILSGCSGGGKSTLLAELADRGFATVSEAGRRIVEQELRGDGRSLPWIDLVAFAERAIALAAQDRTEAPTGDGWVFFDRGVPDAAMALEHAAGRPASVTLGLYPRYHAKVFLTPPWQEIFVTDEERRHSLDEAIAEYERLVTGYGELGYETVILPLTGVSERADLVLHHLNDRQS